MTLVSIVKKTQRQIDNGKFAAKRQKRKMENANAQNSTFANRTSRHTTKVCKRAVFLPTHPWKLVHLRFNERKNIGLNNV